MLWGHHSVNFSVQTADIWGARQQRSGLALPAYKYSRTKAPVALTSKKTFGVRGCGLSQERFTWLPAVLKKHRWRGKIFSTGPKYPVLPSFNSTNGNHLPPSIFVVQWSRLNRHYLSAQTSKMNINNLMSVLWTQRSCSKHIYSQSSFKMVVTQIWKRLKSEDFHTETVWRAACAQLTHFWPCQIRKNWKNLLVQNQVLDTVKRRKHIFYISPVQSFIQKPGSSVAAGQRENCSGRGWITERYNRMAQEEDKGAAHQCTWQCQKQRAMWDSVTYGQSDGDTAWHRQTAFLPACLKNKTHTAQQY